MLDIYYFIALDNPDAADRILSRLQSRVEMLALNPRLYQRRPDIRPSTRAPSSRGRIWSSMKLIPTPTKTRSMPLKIVRVVDGRRNHKNLFEAAPQGEFKP